MKRLVCLLLFLPSLSFGHPGIGIVKDTKGNIYYSDLQQVWKISNGRRSIAVPGVHTHELYIDRHDNLYGEHVLMGNEVPDSFFHYLWILRPDGVLDTVTVTQPAYINIHYSLARDLNGNEYYTKRFIKNASTDRIYKRPPGGAEFVLAEGEFKGVSWLHPQRDESLLYVQNNNVYRVSKEGKIRQIATNIADEVPSFDFSKGNKTIWGAWEDAERNVYVAVFSDQTVRKIDSNGVVSDYYKSTGQWTPIHGVFDNQGKLWVMESSDKNEVRVVQQRGMNIVGATDRSPSLLYLVLCIAGIGGIILVYLFLRSRKFSSLA